MFQWGCCGILELVLDGKQFWNIETRILFCGEIICYISGRIGTKMDVIKL